MPDRIGGRGAMGSVSQANRAELARQRTKKKKKLAAAKALERKRQTQRDRLKGQMLAKRKRQERKTVKKLARKFKKISF